MQLVLARITLVSHSSSETLMLAAGSWSGLSALPWSLHGARNGTGCSPATDRGKKSVSVQRNMREEGGMQGREAGAAPDVA